MENTFKSSVFGGFNRDDVIRYIEKTSLESKQQIEALEQESDGLCRENAELRDKLAAAERERDKFAESYSTASSAQDALKKGLAAAFGLLKSGGRLSVITFHSLEDRIVKQQMNKWCEGCTCPKDFPVCVCGNKPKGKLIYKKGLAPSEEELRENPRARSARLRVIEKL